MILLAVAGLAITLFSQFLTKYAKKNRGACVAGGKWLLGVWKSGARRRTIEEKHSGKSGAPG
jgi:hypothetical protein